MDNSNPGKEPDVKPVDGVESVTQATHEQPNEEESAQPTSDLEPKEQSVDSVPLDDVDYELVAKDTQQPENTRQDSHDEPVAVEEAKDIELTVLGSSDPAQAGGTSTVVAYERKNDDDNSDATIVAVTIVNVDAASQVAVPDDPEQTATIELEVAVGENSDVADAAPSKLQRFIENWAKIIYLIVVIVTFSLVAVLIAANNPDSDSLELIGLVCFDMVLCGILMPLVGLCFIKAWTQSTWWLVWFVTYVGLIVDVFALATYLTEIQVPLILYGVVKVLLLFQAFVFAKVDGRLFVPSIISSYITVQFIRHDSQLYRLIPLYAVCWLIQIIMFSIGTMAFVIEIDPDTGVPSLSPMFIIALLLFVGINNTLRHFLAFMTARVLGKYFRIDEDAEQVEASADAAENESNKEEKASNESSFQVIKDVFFESYSNKFASIICGSFLVTTSPVWYFLTNLMQGVRIATALLILLCLPFSSDEDGEGGTCCGSIIVCVSGITNLIAACVRKVSKWTVRLTAPQLLYSAGLKNITFWKAILIQAKEIKEESKDAFGSDMLFLDNVILSNNTHLCLLVSSIGAWITYQIAPEAAVVGWVAGYCACRTMFQMVDVILQVFLIAWFVAPRIIYQDRVLFELLKTKTLQKLTELYKDENEEFVLNKLEEEINAVLSQVTGLQKTTDPNMISNVQQTNTQLVGQQQTIVVVHQPSGQVVAAQSAQAVQVTHTVVNNVGQGGAVKMIE